MDTFQKYDAPDFKHYLGLKFGHLQPVEEEEESCGSAERESGGSSRGKSSSETSPTSSVTTTPESRKGNENRCIVTSLGGNGRGSVVGNIHHGSVSRKSSNVKSKIKGVFRIGSKKKQDGILSSEKGLETPGRTKALLGKHDGVHAARRG